MYLNILHQLQHISADIQKLDFVAVIGTIIRCQKHLFLGVIKWLTLLKL